MKYSPLNGGGGRLRPGRDAKLGQDVLHVVFYRVLCNVELIRDLLVTPPAHDQREYFHLPGAENGTGKLGCQRRGYGRWEKGAACVNRPNRLQQLVMQYVLG